MLRCWLAQKRLHNMPAMQQHQNQVPLTMVATTTCGTGQQGHSVLSTACAAEGGDTAEHGERSRLSKPLGKPAASQASSLQGPACLAAPTHPHPHPQPYWVPKFWLRKSSQAHSSPHTPRLS